MVLSRLTKITGPGVATDTNWVGNNADFTGITTSATSFNIGVTTIHSNLIEAHNIKSTGIVTATGGSFSGNVTAVDGTFTGNVSIAGTLTYEDVTNVDTVGIVTAAALDVDDFLDVGSSIKLGNAGVITATSFVGSGAALTGIDATAIKDSGGNVKVQAQASGAVYTGIHTFNSDLDVDGHTNLDNVSVAGITTHSGSTTFDSNITFNGSTSNANWIKSGNKFRLNDNSKVNFGGGDNLQVYHTGTAGYITNNAGAINITGADGVTIGAGISAVGIVTALNFVKTDGTTVGGAMTGYNNDPGENNVTTFIAGRSAGNNIQLQNSDGQSAHGNVLIGDGAGKFAQNGYDYNVSIGSYAHNKLRDGSYNIAIGYRANPNVSTQVSSNTIAIGYETLANFVGGGGVVNNGRNTVVGHAAAGTLQSGGYNLVIGYGADVSSASVSNECTIGASYGSSYAPNHFRIPGIGVSFSEGGGVVTGIMTASSFKLLDGSSVGGVDSDAQYNTVGGTEAGNSFSGTNATDNTLFGFRAGKSINTGDWNTVLGAFALDACTSGSFNLALGRNALTALTDGIKNIAVGHETLASNQSADNNVAVGAAVMNSLSTGEYNTAVGNSAMLYQDTAVQNTSLGYETLKVNTKSSYNVAIGYQSMVTLNRADAGGSNTAVGWHAGKDMTDGRYNSFFGTAAGRALTTGEQNTIIGAFASAGSSALTGSLNTFVGYGAGKDSTTSGSNNTIIGCDAEASSSSVSNEVTIGDANVTKFRIPGINVTLKDNGGTPTQGHVLTVDGSGEAGFAAVSADLVNDTSPQLGGDLDTNSHHILLDDAHAVKFGDDTDLEIQHSGSHAFMQNATGSLYFDTTGNLYVRNAAGSSTYMYASGNEVALYHTGSKKFETTSYGAKVTGMLNFASAGSPNISLLDNGKIALGQGDDLQIYHDGTNSILYNNTGQLALRGNEIQLTAKNTEKYFVGTLDGAVELYHDGTKTVETHGSGLTFNQGSGNLIKYGTTSEMANAAINIYRGGTGYANIRLSSNYGCGLYMAGANNNTDEFGINQDNQKNGYLDNRGGFISFNTGSSGTTRMRVENSAQVTVMGNVLPSSNNSYDLGSSSYRWRNVYSFDLQLSNKGGANDVDGTWGDYTIQEGESKLYVINNRTGKKYSLVMEEE